MRKSRMFFTLLTLCLGVLWGGAEQALAQSNPIQPSTWGGIKAMYGQPVEKEGAQGSYPNYCFTLNVPFLVQYPPGDRYNTKNCGQACGVMLGGYYNRGQVNSSIITSENDWLYRYTGDSRYLDPNGWYTGGSRMTAYQELLRQYHGIYSTVYYGRYADDVVNEAVRGNPPIAGVMISDGRIVRSGGASHWVLVIGYDGNNVILNDPGTVSGSRKACSIADFEASWATQGKTYLAVHK